MDAFEVYGSSWVSVWAIDPGSKSAPNSTVFHTKWEPWLPRLRKFIRGKTVSRALYRGGETGPRVLEGLFEIELVIFIIII
eukprot:SAG22_NODE_479_length_9968_cov_43.841524_2_plen_81_part_00